MANWKRKCKHCKEWEEFDKGALHPIGFFCCYAHALEFARENQEKAMERLRRKVKADQNKAAKVQRKKDKAKKNEILSFPAKMKKLQRLVNQFAREIRHNDMTTCCTCSAPIGSAKFDAGHWIPVGAGGGDRRRFNLMNIHPQCSVNCNQHGSGRRDEYRKFLVDRYGADKVAWLECESNHPTLKEQFPTTQAWLDELDRYRKLIRAAGLSPAA